MDDFPDSLVSERLVLQRFSESDISDRYLGWLNDPEVVRYSNQRFIQHDRAISQGYLQSFQGTDNLFLSIRNKQDKVMIGTMTAYIASHHGTADMGILIGERTLWGQGYGLEAWSCLMDYLLHQAGIRKVTAGTMHVNKGMLHIMQQSGMRHEATRHQQEMLDGDPVDILYYARFKDGSN